MIYLTIVRHGETTYNVNKILQGQLDTPLTPAGVDQCDKVGRRLGKEMIHAIYSSDLSRAFMTAEAILSHHRSHGMALLGAEAEVQGDPRLREVCLGIFQDRPSEELGAYLRENAMDDEDPYPGGESFTDVRKRARSFLNDVIEKHWSNQETHIIAVSHGGWIRALLSVIEDLGFELPPYGGSKAKNTAVYKFNIKKLKRAKGEADEQSVLSSNLRIGNVELLIEATSIFNNVSHLAGSTCIKETSKNSFIL
eukprot:Nk52_evm100s226 gene=Nk52_evmTU100s226